MVHAREGWRNLAAATRNIRRDRLRDEFFSKFFDLLLRLEINLSKSNNVIIQFALKHVYKRESI